MEADIIMMENQSKGKVCNLKSWPNAESHGALEEYNCQLMKTGGYIHHWIARELGVHRSQSQGPQNGSLLWK